MMIKFSIGPLSVVGVKALADHCVLHVAYITHLQIG
jgi:hypothetical protein